MIWASSKIGSRVGALRSKLRGRLSLIERGCVHKIGKFANPSIKPPFHIFSSSSWSAGVINPPPKKRRTESYDILLFSISRLLFSSRKCLVGELKLFFQNTRFQIQSIKHTLSENNGHSFSFGIFPSPYIIKDRSKK